MAPESHQNLFNMGSLTRSHITTNEEWRFTRNWCKYITRKKYVKHIFIIDVLVRFLFQGRRGFYWPSCFIICPYRGLISTFCRINPGYCHFCLFLARLKNAGLQYGFVFCKLGGGLAKAKYWDSFTAGTDLHKRENWDFLRHKNKMISDNN